MTRSRPPNVQSTRRLPASRKRLGRVSLRVTRGPDRGKLFRLAVEPSRPLIGGRGPHNDIVLGDDSVSGEHFEIRVQESALVLRDRESTNGLRIGGVPIIEAHLVVGARFSAGESELELVSADPVESSLWPDETFEGMAGRSSVMRELFVRLDVIARQDGKLGRIPVVLGGETGTGKEVAARAIHARSSRARHPFVAVNCSAISRDLAESLLFGHVRGSFTGAHDTREGLFEAASGGTLFLDEIAELPPDLQAKLLRPLELQEITRVGEHIPRKVDVRVLCATHRNLGKLVEQERFREDLYYRLNGIFIEMPSLRERGEDIEFLAERFLADVCDGSSRRLGIGDAARAALRAERWPGNVRQLQRVIQRAAIVATGSELSRSDLSLDVGSILHSNLEFERLLTSPIREASEEFERKYYRALLARHKTRAEAARSAGITTEGLRAALRRLGLVDDGKD